MRIEDLEKEILDILADSQISVDEKTELRRLAACISADERRFIRNKAFELARQQVTDDPGIAQYTLKWLEKLVKTIDVADASVLRSSAYFSPGDDCRNQLLDLIQSAKKCIDICVFTISDDRLTEAILAAHQQGIDVRVVTDNDKSSDRGSDIDELIEAGIKLRMDKTPYHMHHKFMLVDSAILASGSFNWTRSATERNHENILVSGDVCLVDAFQQKFEELWQQFG